MSLNNEDILKERLVGFGLTETDAVIYLYLLKLGKESGGSNISLATKLHRQYVYNSLPNLISIRLVEEVPKGKQNKYRALSPNIIEQLGRKKALAATDLARDLNSISNIGNEQEFEVIQGEKAMLEFEMDYIYTVPGDYEELIIGGASGGFQKTMGDHLDEYLTLKKEKNIIVKYIGTTSEKDAYLKNIGSFSNQIFKYLEQLPDGLANMVIRPQAVCFYSYSNPPHVYVVKSKAVADHYKKFFEMLWIMSSEAK